MVARKAHNLEVTGSNPVSATFLKKKKMEFTILYLYSIFFYNINILLLSYSIHKQRRIAGIEPASSPWQGEILPFNYIRIFVFIVLYTLKFYLCRTVSDIY